jgi:hypothetical protein
MLNSLAANLHLPRIMLQSNDGLVMRLPLLNEKKQM